MPCITRVLLMTIVFFFFVMIRRPPISTRTDTLFPLHYALPILPPSGGDGRHGFDVHRGEAVAAQLRLVSANPRPVRARRGAAHPRSEEHTSELQSLMRISYAVFCLKKKN